MKVSKNAKSVKAWGIMMGKYLSLNIYCTESGAKETCRMHKEAHMLKRNDWKVVRVIIKEIV